MHKKCGISTDDFHEPSVLFTQIICGLSRGATLRSDGAGRIARESFVCWNCISAIKEKTLVPVAARTDAADPTATEGGECGFLSALSPNAASNQDIPVMLRPLLMFKRIFFQL